MREVSDAFGAPQHLCAQGHEVSRFGAAKHDKVTALARHRDLLEQARDQHETAPADSNGNAAEQPQEVVQVWRPKCTLFELALGGKLRQMATNRKHSSPCFKNASQTLNKQDRVSSTTPIWVPLKQQRYETKLRTPATLRGFPNFLTRGGGCSTVN